MSPAPAILRPSHNCWRIEHATRVAFLVDGENYFAAVRAAAMRAQRSIYIVGWDFDSRTRIPKIDVHDELPIELGPFLDTLARRRANLNIYILDWDFTMLYAGDRELLPRYKLGWRTHRRVHFRLDDTCPINASHHQKVVVIDDCVAFVGGMDLTQKRWDTTAHAPANPDRCDQGGTPYAPFHDIQMMVDDKAAAALGELARERWLRATDRTLEATAHLTDDPWPPTVQPDITDVDVAISRTDGGYGGQPSVHEIKQLNLDAIAAARKSIYIENQYLTAHIVGEALARRLREPDGPEIVLISRLVGEGWLETSTMEVLRTRWLERLRAADLHGRLRIFYPDCDGIKDCCIQVHSKLMIIDDRFVRIGSGNLNNRSLSLDSECDLAIDAPDVRAKKAIVHLRNRLMAEHLGVEPKTVALQYERNDGSLIATIDALHGNKRDLKKLEGMASSESAILALETTIVDPEHPVNPDRLISSLVPPKRHRPAARRITTIALGLGAVAALAAVWHWTPLREWVNPSVLVNTIGRLEASPFTPLWMLGAYVVASLTAIPITALIVSTVLVFGPLVGFGYALSGTLLGAAASFLVGRRLAHNVVQQLAGTHLHDLSKHLAKRGLLAMIAIRMLPVAPFTVVNLVAGASHISFRNYLLGTLLGMTPGMLALTIFSDRLAEVVRDPSPKAIVILAAVTIGIITGAISLHRWLARRRSGHTPPEPAEATDTRTAANYAPDGRHL